MWLCLLNSTLIKDSAFSWLVHHINTYFLLCSQPSLYKMMLMSSFAGCQNEQKLYKKNSRLTGCIHNWLPRAHSYYCQVKRCMRCAALCSVDLCCAAVALPTKPAPVEVETKKQYRMQHFCICSAVDGGSVVRFSCSTWMLANRDNNKKKETQQGKKNKCKAVWKSRVHQGMKERIYENKKHGSKRKHV